MIMTHVVTRELGAMMIDAGHRVYQPGQQFDDALFAMWMFYAVNHNEKHTIQAAIDALDSDQALLVQVNTQEIRDRLDRGEDVQLNQALHCVSLEIEDAEDDYREDDAKAASLKFSKLTDMLDQGVLTVALIDGKYVKRN